MNIPEQLLGFPIKYVDGPFVPLEDPSDAAEGFGGVCWYCHWGWSKPVADIYHKAVHELGYADPMEFGIGHVVWSDENFSNETLAWVLKQNDSGRYPDRENAIVRRSLEDLLKIPESVRDCEPSEYDGRHPENFPPPIGIEMARKR